jgi:hypothetical protein
MNIDNNLKTATTCHADGAENKVLLLFARDCAHCHLQNFLFGQAGTSSCRHSYFGKNIDMLRRPTVGWASQ